MEKMVFIKHISENNLTLAKESLLAKLETIKEAKLKEYKKAIAAKITE